MLVITLPVQELILKAQDETDTEAEVAVLAL